MTHDQSAHSTSEQRASAKGLGVAICAMNNERTLDSVLASVAPIADRIVVVDSGSTDGTIEIAQRHGAEVIHRAWPGPVDQKGFAIDQVRDQRWVLLLDSDEILEPTLRESIRAVVETDDERYDAWTLNRIVRMFGTDLRYTFQPERRLRLIRGSAGRVVGMGRDGLGGHDRIELDGDSAAKIGKLEGDCIHDSWDDLESMLRSHISFAKRAATHHPKGGGALDILFRPPIAMFKQYVLKQGFRDGRAGFFAAATVFSATLTKHLFIARRHWIERDGSADAARSDSTQS